ncbi:MAG: DNA repair protein RadA [Candidatus Omnitrophica bacterium]|nr:DNA repair protein RadA [Candidatus Omnitrophota bacterium]MCM8793670.1 DNA repair protein RadA [Candidatus Omnitrophota bacterium]
MAKTKTVFICQNCGYRSLRWLGKCPDCEGWNSFVEEKVAASLTAPEERKSSSPLRLSEIDIEEEKRIFTGIGEFDRLLGGGVVPGSVVLVGGNPGIGKSTLLLQVAHSLSIKDNLVLYVSGEESLKQTKMRAQRLGLQGDSFYIVNETNLDFLREDIDRLNPRIVVIDSVQVLYRPEFSSGPGTVTQVRECAHLLTSLAKEREISMFFIGHVTKEGMLAGPKILEHLVDTVLYFEGEDFTQRRILRAVKNRFGSTNEIAIFEMTTKGLVEVKNPSEIFLGDREEKTAGSVIVPVIEGTRPLLVEIQALVVPSLPGFARRRCTGLDFNRIPLLIAVLEKRLGLHLGNQDIFVNVVGGVKIVEPAVDLGVVSGIVSSFRNLPLSKQTVVLGEVGLGGEVRAVSFLELRLQEAERLGFRKVILPMANLSSLQARKKDLEILGVKNIEEAVDLALG